MSKLPRLFLLLAIVCALGSAQPVLAADSYAAIAFSPSTGQWGYGNGYSTRAAALQRARNECGASDARTFWTKNAWIALAVSDQDPGGYGWAWASTAAQARAKARNECLKRNPDARVVVTVSAYN